MDQFQMAEEKQRSCLSWTEDPNRKLKSCEPLKRARHDTLKLKKTVNIDENSQENENLIKK